MPENNQILSIGNQLVGMPLAGPESFSQEQIAYLKRAMGIDETVLYSGDAVGQTAFNLSESLMNFETIKVWIRSKVDNLNPISIIEVPTTTIGSTLSLFTTERFDSSWQWITWRFDYTVSNSGTTLQLAANAYGGSKSNNSWGAGASVMSDVHVYKVIGIHRIAGGN